MSTVAQQYFKRFRLKKNHFSRSKVVLECTGLIIQLNRYAYSFSPPTGSASDWARQFF